MALVRTEDLSLAGLVTQPNELGLVPPGSLSQSSNYVMRRPGVLETLPAPNNTTQVSHAATLTWRTFALRDTNPATSEMLRVYGDVGLGYADHVGWTSPIFANNPSFGPTILTGLDSRDLTFYGGLTQFTESHGSYILTEGHSPIAFHGQNSDALLAGLPVPGVIDIVTQTTDPDGPIGDNKYVSYAALFIRKYDDGYEYRGAPTGSYLVSPLGPSFLAQTATLRVRWSKGNTPIQPGTDYIEIYRTAQADTAEEIVPDFFLSTVYKLDASDKTNGFSANIIDTTLDNALGAALYTNAFQDGATKANWMPPPARDAVTYRGATLYAATAQWMSTKLATRGRFGAGVYQSADATQGIGIRRLSATSTIGLNTVTVAAPDLAGVQIGQMYFAWQGGNTFPAGSTITNIVGTTVTMSGVASGTSVGFLFVSDVLIVNGVPIPMSTIQDAQDALAIGDTGVVMLVETEQITEDGNVTATYDGISFQLVNPVPGEPAFTLSGTNQQNYSPNLNDAIITDSPKGNRVYFSRPQQPEAVPLTNWIEVGSGNVLRIVDTQSAVMAFCDDGLYRISGDGVTFRVDPVDSSARLLNGDAIDTLEGNVYAWLSSGAALVTDDGYTVLSTPIQNRIQENLPEVAATLGPGWRPGSQVVADVANREIWFIAGNVYSVFPLVDTQNVYVFNLDTKQWVSHDLRDTQAFGNFFYNPAYRAIMAFTDDEIWGFLPDDILADGGYTRFYKDAQFLVNSYKTEIGSTSQWLDLTLQWSTSNTGTPRDPSAMVTPVFLNGTDQVVGSARSTEAYARSAVFPVPRGANTGNYLNFSILSQSLLEEGLNGYVAIEAVSVRFRPASQTTHR